MIDEDTLKKYNLKAVPFSSIGEGETFQTEFDYGVDQFTRRLIGGNIYYADNRYPDWKLHTNYVTVYVPVDRVTN